MSVLMINYYYRLPLTRINAVVVDGAIGDHIMLVRGGGSGCGGSAYPDYLLYYYIIFVRFVRGDIQMHSRD